MQNKVNGIVMVPIGDIVPNEKNNNIHTEEQKERARKIFDHQGFRSPLLISNRTGKLVAGHLRLFIAKEKGATELPCMFQDFDSEAQEYSHMTADNALASWASLDLSSINNEMLDFGPEFDIDLLGIKDFAIEPAEKFEPQSDADDVPEVNHPITRTGDVWLLGKHRLMCGDSTMMSDVEKLMNGKRAQISFTSPPYNAGDEVEIGSKGQKYETHDDSMSGGNYLKLLADFTSNTLMFSDLSIVNIQQLSGNKIEFIEWLNLFKNNIVDIGIWNKIHGTPCLPRRVMSSAFEYVVFISSEENPPKTIKTAPDFHGSINNVYTAQKQTRNEFSKIHRATFPAHLPEYYIEKFSTGDVIELFNGTGTTLIACEKLGRGCFAMDMDPLYIDVTIKRWQQYTGQKAVLESDGRKYDELYTERHPDEAAQ